MKQKKQLEARIAALERRAGVRGELRILFTNKAEYEALPPDEQTAWLRQQGVGPHDDLRLILLYDV